MAGYVSKNAAERWNNAARVVSGGGAGSKFVPGLYRTPKPICDDLPPGAYKGVAAATILAGATGNVTYDGNTYSAVNHSGCGVTNGDLVGLFVSPNCEMFFIPCECPP
jgi:hypothetical protein